MSYAAIAAVLARPAVSAGERLVAFSLASYANRDELAWPGSGVAAARAGMSASAFLEARDRLVGRGLVAIEEQGRGRGKASTLRLLFAQAGPWWESDINVELLEAVLCRSRASGSARVLLAVLAALSDKDGVVEDRSTDELRRAAGMADSTYRRARTALLHAGEAVARLGGDSPRVGGSSAGPDGLRSDGSTRKLSGSERRFRRKVSGSRRCFGQKVSGSERGFARKVSGSERGFGATGRENPARNPARNPASQRAHG